MTKLLTEESMMHIVNAYFLLQRVIESSDIYHLDEVAYGRVYNAFEHIRAITPDNVEDLKFSGSPSAAWLSICDGIKREMTEIKSQSK